MKKNLEFEKLSKLGFYKFCEGNYSTANLSIGHIVKIYSNV